MKLCKACSAEKPLSEFYNQKSAKDGKQKWCVACVGQYYRDNNERIRKSNNARQKANGGAAQKKYLDANRETVRARQKEWVVKNVEHFRKLKSDWRRANREVLTAREAARRAYKLGQTPAWACKDALADTYRKCAEMSRQTGVKHHVDHVIPLKHKMVCGLHVPANLMILTAAENLAKSNFFEAGW